MFEMDRFLVDDRAGTLEQFGLPISRQRATGKPGGLNLRIFRFYSFPK